VYLHCIQGPHYGDRYAQSGTSLRFQNGKSLNADKTPYFVLPPQVAKQYGAKPGDVGLIRYNGKETAAVFGDVGPRNKIGEISRNAAQRLGIPDSPNSGGVPKGVEFVVFPKTARAINSDDDVSGEALAARIPQ
jgi:hypothetical protein